MKKPVPTLAELIRGVVDNPYVPKIVKRAHLPNHRGERERTRRLRQKEKLA